MIPSLVLLSFVLSKPSAFVLIRAWSLSVFLYFGSENTSAVLFGMAQILSSSSKNVPFYSWMRKQWTGYSQLSQSGHHCKADISLRRTWLAGPDRIKFLLFFCNETLYKADTSLRRTARAGPEDVRLRESSLYSIWWTNFTRSLGRSLRLIRRILVHVPILTTQAGSCVTRSQFRIQFTNILYIHFSCKSF